MTSPARALLPAESATPSPALVRRIRRRLLAWYDRHRRDLPWRRREGDAYAQWVAEIMLQQTRVETVISYYERFLRRFPDVESLARARHETVLKHWEGLGYYRRIVHLHEAARMLRRERRPIPANATELRALPGIGEYTSAAISSIAFGQREAAVDGNVARVLSRLFDLSEDPRTSAGRGVIRAIAVALVSPERPGDFNQAWMDLGSTVCTPRRPDCPRCPLREGCLSAAAGQPGRRPHRAAGALDVPSLALAVALVRREGRLLMRRRPRGGLWSGLWEFPTTEIVGNSLRSSRGTGRSIRGASRLRRRPEREAQVAVAELLAALGVNVVSAVPIARVRHRLTHRALEFHVFTCDALSGQHAGLGTATKPYRWLTDNEMRRLPVSTAHRRIHAAAIGDETGEIASASATAGAAPAQAL